MNNDSEPWKSLGISEVEYFKRLFLEACARRDDKRRPVFCPECRGVMEAAYSGGGHYQARCSEHHYRHWRGPERYTCEEALDAFARATGQETQ